MNKSAFILALVGSVSFALSGATGDEAQVSVSRMQPSVAREKRPEKIDDMASYLKWKWRMDLSDPATGLDNDALKRGLERIVCEWEDKEPWIETSARMFAYLADNMAIGFSRFDCFPAIACWNRWDRPLNSIVSRRSRTIDARYAPGLAEEIKALHDSGRGRADWKDFDHSAPDWDRILALGFTGMKARVDSYTQDTPFYRAEKSAAATIMRFLDRLIAEAQRKNSTCSTRSTWLEKEIASLERLRAGPPQTCFDVMQFTMLYFILSEHVNRFQVRTLGNIDRLWWPYYRADLASGRTTEAEFREEFRHFIWQFGSIDNYWGHPIYLGGTKKDGSTEYNPLSEIILDVVDGEALPTPKFQVKLADNTPEAIWRKSLDMLRRHRSLVLMNEKGMADSMKPLGLSDDECRDLLVWGCYEYLPRGTGNCTSGFRLNMLQPVLDILAECATNGAECARLSDGGFPAFKAEYKRQLLANADRLMAIVNESERHLAEIHPSLVLSLSIDSALERGVDAFSTGMTYNYSAVGEVGFASAVDSLLAVKEFVYDRGEVSLPEFARILADDWKGHGELHGRVRRSALKWGCGNAAADDLAKEILEAMTSHIIGKPNGRGGKWTVYGLHSRAFIEFGVDSGASPDGRNSGDHLSKNVAPSVGAETQGVTGTLRSYAKIRPENFPCGSVLDVMIHPSSVSGEKGLSAFRALVEVWMKNGGTALNVNIVSPETLRDAQAHPEKYENLQVRVAGWNVRWIDIPRKEQDEYIARIEAVGGEGARPASRPVDVYLLIGQSNMAGRGAINAANRLSSERVLKFTKDCKWAEGVEPIHFDRPTTGAGPGLAFARAMADLDKDVVVGLVPCAEGGSPLSRWEPGHDLYTNAVARTRAALATGGRLRGILWHQGEADSWNRGNAESYARRLTNMVARLRADLGADGVPFIAGEVGAHYGVSIEKRGGKSFVDEVNRQIKDAVASLPAAGWVSAEGLEPGPDGIHFTTESAYELGRRYARQMRTLCGTIPAAATGAAESSRKQRDYLDMTWWDPYVEDIADSDTYLRRKFRQDVTDRTTGVDVDGLKKILADIVESGRASGESWWITKAKCFSVQVERESIDVSPLDWFPAIAVWDRWSRPITGVVKNRAKEVNSEKLPDLLCEEWEHGNADGTWNMWQDFDHSVPDWRVIMKLGFPGMKERLEKYAVKGDPFYEGLAIAMDAMLAGIDRFIEQGRKNLTRSSLSSQSDEAEILRTSRTLRETRRLEKEIACLERLRNGPPETAYDMMMFVWLYFFWSEHLDGVQCRSLTELDVFLTPYYDADIAAGRTTEAEFREQLKHFLWQWGSVANYWNQPVGFGGTNPDGTSAFNHVSEIILDVMDGCALPTPKFLVKVAPNTPDWAWEKMLDMARRHRSIAFIGEEPAAKTMKKWMGASDEDCRTMVMRGCYEFDFADSCNRTGCGYMNILKPVEKMLEEVGVQSSSSRMENSALQLQLGTPTRLHFETFDAFKAEYLRRLAATTKRCREIAFEFEKVLADVNPSDMMTLSTENALKTRRDAFADGCPHGNNTAILSAGLGTAVDALLAVKEIVYERREMSLAELGRVMASNWSGHEGLRRRMLRSRRKWGNNDPEANALGAEIAKCYGAQLNGIPNSRGGVFLASGHSARQYVELGEKTGATPDGRKAGDEISKNMSPTMGVDTEGATALVATLASSSVMQFPADYPLDMMLHPSVCHGEKGLRAMRSLVEIFHRNGGSVIQFTVFSAEELRDAQLHPEKYENLQVRVCGWNVRWNDLCKAEQDAYIRRAENVMKGW